MYILTAMLTNKKTYYSIREVCEITGLEPHVLRYWESEFTLLRPKKNRAGNRAFREKDIEIVKIIQRLVHVEKYTIQGARKKLVEIRRGISELPDDDELTDSLHGESVAVVEAPVVAAIPEPVIPPVVAALPVVAVAPAVVAEPAVSLQTDSLVLSLFDPQVQQAEAFLSGKGELKEVLGILGK